MESDGIATLHFLRRLPLKEVEHKHLQKSRQRENLLKSHNLDLHPSPAVGLTSTESTFYNLEAGTAIRIPGKGHACSMTSAASAKANPPGLPPGTAAEGTRTTS